MSASSTRPNPGQVAERFRAIQDGCCAALEALEEDGAFVEDEWRHGEGGGGRTRVLEDGRVFEKGGVNFSLVRGDHLPAAATAGRRGLADKPFIATGVSLVMHPRNPFVPTSHMNVRFFIVDPDAENPSWWFGGGYDLTPYYGFDEDCVHWHRVIRAACDPFGAELYPRFKKRCDEYFFIPHRNEARGIGGLFFDDFNELGYERCLDFTRGIGESFIDAYAPIVEKRKDRPYQDRHREFQLYRRGRYVEFNLVYDRGTLFGLQSKGRAESILMSLPPSVAWKYNHAARPGSEEEKLTHWYLKPRDWAGEPGA